MPVAATDLRHLPKLTKYDLVEEIGHGGMATVYRARDPRLRRDVAVKVLHRHLLDSPEVAHRFRAEAQAVAKLRHPNILEVYDVAEEDEREKYLVVELLRGESLRQLLRKSGALPPEICCAIGIELLSALQHAHSQGVIHRDIKPENIMVDIAAPLREGEGDGDADGDGENSQPLTDSKRASDAEVGGRASEEPAAPSSRKQMRHRVSVKVMDFGIAKLLDAQGVTSTGQVLGSPAHMAPEQIEGAEVDARADVFAVGIVLYEAMTGELPFRGQNPAQVLQRVLRGEFVKLDSKVPKAGACIAAVVAKALARDRELRFPSARALQTALRAELAFVGFADSRQLLSEYFEDPATFVVSYETSLKATLCQRGADAQANGDALKAASAFNRALAYAPGDVRLMRTVAQMRKKVERAQRLRQAAPFVLGFVLVAAAAFGLTRTLRSMQQNERATIAAAAASAKSAAIAASATRERAEADARAAANTELAANDAGGGLGALLLGREDAGRVDAAIRLASTAAGSAATVTSAGTKVAGRRTLLLGRVQPTTGVQLSVDDGPLQSVGDGSQMGIDEGAHDIRFSCALDLCEAQVSHIIAGDRDVELNPELRLKAATLVVEGNLERHYQIDKFPDLIVRSGIPARIAVRRGDESVIVTELETGQQKSVLLPPGKTARVAFQAP